MGSQSSRQDKNFDPQLFTRTHEVRMTKVFKIKNETVREPTPEPELRAVHVAPPVHVPQTQPRVVLVQSGYSKKSSTSPIYSPQPIYSSQPIFQQRAVPIYQNTLRTIKSGHFYN